MTARPPTKLNSRERSVFASACGREPAEFFRVVWVLSGLRAAPLPA